MRYRDWTTRLHQTIQASLGRPFSWGEFDCCVFAAECSIAICGVDPLELYRGKYRTETGAKRALVKTHGSIEALWDAAFERVPAALAQRGDVALYDGPEGRGVAVLWAGEWWSTAEDGVARIDCVPLVVWRIE